MDIFPPQNPTTAPAGAGVMCAAIVGVRVAVWLENYWGRGSLQGSLTSNLGKQNLKGQFSSFFAHGRRALMHMYRAVL